MMIITVYKVYMSKYPILSNPNWNERNAEILLFSLILILYLRKILYMGIKKNTYGFKKSLKNRAMSLAKRRAHFNERKSMRLISKAKGVTYTHRPERAFKKCIRKKVYIISVPKKFQLFENRSEVIAFLSNLLDFRLNHRVKIINLELQDVEFIDSGAICMLLCVVNHLALYQIRVQGDVPFDEKCKKIFIESGFLNYMKDEDGQPYKIDSSNLIVKAGKGTTGNKNISIAIKKSMEFLLSTPRRYQPAYTVAMEICSNSVEHAYVSHAKNWLLSVHQNDNNTVTFTMTDTGQGILKTLKKKFKRELEKAFLNKNDCDVLFSAFQRKYGSSTEEINRNRGLPCILDKFDNELIRELKVITNNVYLDFEDQTNNQILNKPFPGVLFSWVIDIDCVNKFDDIK